MKRIVSKFFTLSFVIFCLAGCGKIKSFIGNSIQLTECTFVLCHGLGDNPERLEKEIKKDLEQVFGDAHI